MRVRRSTVSGVILLVLAGCSRSQPEEKVGPMPWETALARKPSTPPAGGAGPSGREKAAEPPATVESLRARAQQLYGAGDTAGALRAAEEGLLKDPNSREIRYLVASLAQYRASEVFEGGEKDKAGELFLKSARLIREVQKQAGKNLLPQEQGLLPLAVYNEACCYALAGEPDQALTSLNEAYLELGAENFDDLDKDSDLTSLRKLPAFADLMGKVAVKKDEARKAIVAEAREDALQALARTRPFGFRFTLPDLEGKPFSIDQFAGKVCIVDVWATWCPPCLAEVPHFIALQKAYRDRGLQIIGINYESDQLTPREVKKTIKDFASRLGMNYPCLIGDEATKEKIPGFQAYPTTIFIDRTGKVRAMTVGYKPRETIETIVTTLLAEGGAAGTGDASDEP